jgi:hypothetical protein
MDAQREETVKTLSRGSAEFWLILLLYLAYELLRQLARGRASVSERNAELIRRLTPGPVRRFEWDLHAATLHHPTIHELANVYYSVLHLTVTAAVLVWAWWRRPEEYRTYRTVLALVTVGALLIFWLFPVAPPRLMPGLERGVLDPSAVRGRFVNPFAAFPSLHLAWSVWCAWAVSRHLPWPAAPLAWLYPLATAMVLVATANHYTLDLLGGMLLVALAVAVVGIAWRLSVGRSGRRLTAAGRRSRSRS